ncbi:MAG: hypothetical protein P4L26_12040 [Terracidiphilus sp.]|nr:hypothetical protein [Terracidiphilus sp.]
MPPQPNPNAVFLNIPYDEEFQKLYLAYIVGLSQLGFDPYLASGIPGGERRLDRILALVQSCRYSIHDLSRVELSPIPPATPRFNMPLELGITIAWAKLYPKRHTWFLWESSPRRLQKSMSDLDGTDPYIHSGTVEGVLSELRNAFVRDGAPTVQRMMETYRVVEGTVEGILTGAGTRNLYAASVFRELRLVALEAVHRTDFQTLASAKAIIDQVHADYESGAVLPRSAKAYAVISEARTAQIRAVKAMVEYERLRTRNVPAQVLAAAQSNLAAALPDLPALLASITKLYTTRGK